jgi:hypothetical protein
LHKAEDATVDNPAMAGRSSASTAIWGLILGRPLDFALLPFNDRQQKLSGDKSERQLIENGYSPTTLKRPSG